MHSLREVREPENAALRLGTLITIRWIAVIGQLAAVLFVWLGLGFELLALPCIAIVAISAWLNVFLRFRYPGNVRWYGARVMGLLAYDILQLALLLYLTGGIQNPFAVLLTVPVVVSATTQKAREILPLFALAIGAASILVFFHQPLPWNPGESFVMPLEFKAGIWTAIVSSMAFTAAYTYRVADESRKLANALAATELVLQREQHMSNLDGLTTAAAHELGTPLATISLVAKELLRDLPKKSPHREDVALLRGQAERCREIMRKISSLSSEGDENVSSMNINVLMEEVAAPHRDFDVELAISGSGPEPQPVTRRNAAILYGLGNLVENAVDFAGFKVDFSARWDADTITFRIADDGPGFPYSVLERIGDPFISTRNHSKSESGGGLGLGLFVAKTLLERYRAGLTVSNRDTADGGGALVEVTWKREDFEYARTDA